MSGDIVQTTGIDETIQYFEWLGAGAHERLQAAVSDQGKQFLKVVQDQKLSGEVLNVRSGALRDSVHLEMQVASDSIMAVVGTDLIYAAIHEYGGVIVPKVANALRFCIDGRWIFAKSVTMPERSYLRSTLAERESEIRAALTAAVMGHA